MCGDPPCEIMAPVPDPANTAHKYLLISFTKNKFPNISSFDFAIW